MLQGAAAAAATTMFGAGHSHEAAGHRQLGRLGEVGQDTLCGVGQTSLQGRLRLWGLSKNAAAQSRLLHRGTQTGSQAYLAERVMPDHGVGLGGAGAGRA